MKTHNRPSFCYVFRDGTFFGFKNLAIKNYHFFESKFEFIEKIVEFSLKIGSRLDFEWFRNTTRHS